MLVCDHVSACKHTSKTVVLFLKLFLNKRTSERIHVLDREKILVSDHVFTLKHSHMFYLWVSEKL